jgi:hypothetical protein
MNKRGRPKKNGFQPFWVLGRETYVLYAYQQAREAGQKHFVAVQEAVIFVQQNLPGMPISDTEVRRILAKWRSTRRSHVLSVRKPDPAASTIAFPDGRVVRRLYTASWLPRAEYPRTNSL